MRYAAGALKAAAGYAAAIFLPWIAASLSMRTQALHWTPLALGFVAIAGVGVYCGFRPGLAAVLSNTLAFNYYILPPLRAWALTGPTILYSSVIFCLGLLIAAMCERQNATRNRLRSALASIQTQKDALLEAQQGSNSVAWTFDAEAGETLWAEGGAEVFGRPFAEVAGPDSFVVEEDRPRFEAAWEGAVSAGKALHVESRVRWPNGEIHWLESRGTLSPSRARLWRGVTIDVTDRKNAELALLRAEKLAAVGRLSATIAHEINNPLESVTNLLYLASCDPRLEPETRRYLAQADQELARLASIARHTLTFVRPPSRRGPANVGEIAEAVAAMFGPRCRSNGGELRLLRRENVELPMPPDDLRQILTNVVSNACDALAGPQGLVEIEISAPDGVAAVEVRDNGVGIAAGSFDRIFDAFFTTKDGLGTGIGLWVTKELVEKNGGRIAVRNGEDGVARTIFRMEFPLEQGTGGREPELEPRRRVGA
jgi:signal transduction histidine kinase